MAFVSLVLVLAACNGPGSDEPARREQDTPAAATPMAEMSGMENMVGTQDTPGMEGMTMGGDGPIRITTRQAALAGVTFAVAREAPVERTVRAVAMAVPNERALGIVNARVSGWVETLHASETGRLVRSGEPLLELYAPELVTAQEELLLAKRLAGVEGGTSLVAAARRRLALWNIAEEEIGAIEASGEIRRRLTIRSPYPGHILEKHVIEGQMVRAGDRLFKIADLSTIWIEPAIFESDISLVRVGQRAQVTFDALPGHLFEGRVTFIRPELDMHTRTLRVRVEVPNRRFLIKPMMYGAVRITAGAPRGVTVPLGAVLPTGSRDLAFVVRQGGVVPTAVVVGTRGDSTVLVADGLAAGDTVVASATFLFDSESQLAAAMAGIMLNMGMGLDMGGMQMEGMDMTGSEAAPAVADTMPGMRMDSARPKERRP
ncbi:MAG TPA: efflux RND transporter periplasmic adaptor subunit [Gemmatimonadales bacterium]